MDYIMETVGLRKSYKGNVVVNDVNIHVPKGAIYGFVGPNGAGKSTVMKMILNLIQPEAGEVQLFGEKVTDQSYEVFKRVGSIIENPYFYEKMTARQNLELHCDYMGFPNKERIDEVLQMVDLQNVEGKQIRHYSLGMKQRLAIARAILAKPEFLRQHRTIAEASAVESPIRRETIGFPSHFFARAHNFKPPGRACQPEADSPMRT